MFGSSRKLGGIVEHLIDGSRERIFRVRMLSKGRVNDKSREVCVSARSPPASLAFIGLVTKYATVRWPLVKSVRPPLLRVNCREVKLLLTTCATIACMCMLYLRHIRLSLAVVISDLLTLLLFLSRTFFVWEQKYSEATVYIPFLSNPGITNVSYTMIENIRNSLTRQSLIIKLLRCFETYMRSPMEAVEI